MHLYLKFKITKIIGTIKVGKENDKREKQFPPISHRPGASHCFTFSSFFIGFFSVNNCEGCY